MAVRSRLVVRLTPRADRDRIDGWSRDAAGRPVLKARVTAPPADGKANAALTRLIAGALDIAPAAVSLVSGGASRLKTLNIEGLDEDQMRRRLGAPP
jgi:hypothetical protein